MSGPGAGGTRVHITGLGFTGATAVSFGGHAANSYTINPAGTAIIAVAPAGHAGTVDVVVNTPIGTSVSWSADRFTYLAPSITAVKPATGSHIGGTKVKITGTALNGVTAVRFGSIPATTYTVNTGGTSITVTAPPWSAGVVDISVTTPGGIERDRQRRSLHVHLTRASPAHRTTPDATAISGESVGLAGIELTTSSLSGTRSNRLSYSPAEGEERTRAP